MGADARGGKGEACPASAGERLDAPFFTSKKGRAMKKKPAKTQPLSINHFESASLPQPQLKHIKGGTGGTPCPPPDDDPQGFVGSDDVVDG